MELWNNKKTNMETKSLLYCIISCISMLLTGCAQSIDEGIRPNESGQGDFIVVHPKAYSISMTRGASNPSVWTKKNGDGEIEITEDVWAKNTTTRSSNAVEDIFWYNDPSIGLYITDKDGKLCIKNMPLNPLSHDIYNCWYDESKKDSYKDLFSLITKEKITSASYFWDDWSFKEQMPTSGANFYGIYPRPFDHIPTAQYNYTRNSVISSSTVYNDNNSISYVFWEAQTDNNIKQFDLMYSQSESASVNGVYGNQNKEKGQSILMPFVHAFSLLNIEIYKGQDYTGEGLLSAISIKGTDISTSGSLNYVTGELTKGTDEGIINRTITETILKDDVPFQTEIIVPPSSANAPTTEGKERLSIVCKIDGNEYKYQMPDDVILKNGMRYNIKLTLSPSGLSHLNIWHGAKVTLDNNPTVLDYGSKAVSGNSSFTVSADDGYVIEKIVKNGDKIAETGGKFKLDKNSTYNIVARPKDNWYAGSESMRVHFDGIMNTAYQTSQNKGVSIWQDLTGNGNDGNLKSFNETENSGWNDRNGLVFDGIDDIVIFPGNINATEYTMEFYLAFDKQKSSATPRLNAEGTAYPAYYLRKMSDGKWHVGLFGHNCPQYDSKVSIEEDRSLVQLDMVYKNKTVTFYKNGEKLDTFTGVRNEHSTIEVKDAVSIPEASLGNRSADNTRTTTGIYHSYILYDRVLTQEEMQKNLEINRARFK